MQDVIIVGASGLGREVLETIRKINQVTPTWNVLGFIDDNEKALDAFDLDYRILGSIQEWTPGKDEQYVLAVANPRAKERIVPVLKERGAVFASVIDPSVSIGERTTLGEGVVIFSDTGISVDVEIGDFVFFNSLVGVGHNAKIGDYCTFGPKACISGATKIGKCVNVGALASTYPGIEVGDYATIGMNSAALRRVKPETTVIGVPAKEI